MEAASKAQAIRDQLPAGGLFAGHEWRITPEPFPLDHRLVKELNDLGRILHQFYRATDLLYRHSLTGKQPAWVAKWLELGKPEGVLDLQRHNIFRCALPRIIRPDILLTEDRWHITELDSVPGGIGLTAWLNESYASHSPIVGEATGMLDGFSNVFPQTGRVHLMVSEESATYRPEMQWLANKLGDRFTVGDVNLSATEKGDSIYRFFELFDLPNIEGVHDVLNAAVKGSVHLTAPPKSYLEEKMVFALFWNENLRSFWERELGRKYFSKLRKMIPQTWLIDPAPLPPHAAMPGLEITDWRQLSQLSQKKRNLILKLSGFNERAWGARSVRLGADLPQTDWAMAVDEAIQTFPKSPWVLQRYMKPRTSTHPWFDFESGETQIMKGRTRLCPYYFVDDTDQTNLGGVLATICPADKKIIHGMRDAILAPCTPAAN